MRAPVSETSLTIDLRERGELPPHAYAFYRLRELAPGQQARVLADEEPRLIMESVSLQLRHHIHWEVVEQGPPLWTVLVRPRDEVAARTLMDLLARDHERLDKLFAQALHKVNAGDVAGAAPLLKEFATGLQRHLHAEDEILAPAFVGPRDPSGSDPTSTMLREHRDIREQVVLLESYFDDDALPEPSEVAPFFGILSGVLAKHETREELNLFPQWDMALKKGLDEAGRDALVERIRAILEGREA
ncbi:hemerythrin domain-containing protein [Ectothiorhodospiraceae bacterium 2226]|nr:hemerythrin domain-containing protein [Ectothiorhodospiraceae bacterium 2226]